ncbi:MAG TPA: hypothetical protein VGS11_04510 [Candidatus Bathyarchaeia archaeon]|nr:hypothetical protein [Candidatus Bathyarchaeia archaeon]
MEPEVSFSPWVKLTERVSLGDALDYPGVYLLAHFATAPSGSVDTDSKEIILIGESHNRTLKQRLKEFHNVVYTGKGFHGPADTYRSKFPSKQRDNLFVSVFPVKIESRIHQKSFVQLLERRLIWEFVQAQAQYPVCNKE